jgi:hypothetical protein
MGLPKTEIRGNIMLSGIWVVLKGCMQYVLTLLIVSTIILGGVPTMKENMTDGHLFFLLALSGVLWAVWRYQKR